MAKAVKKKAFKDRLEDLSGIVEELERGELDLQDAINRFEQGRKLHGQLMEELATYEKRLEKLLDGPDGEDRLVDVDEE